MEPSILNSVKMLHARGVSLRSVIAHALLITAVCVTMIVTLPSM